MSTNFQGSLLPIGLSDLLPPDAEYETHITETLMRSFASYGYDRVKPPLIEFEEICTLESWNSDGLRSLIKTMPHVPNMIEKTLRYPGCVEYLKVLRASGFFSYDEIEVKGVKIKPIDVTSKLLFPKWEMKEGDKDFTIMRIIINQ